MPKYDEKAVGYQISKGCFLAGTFFGRLLHGIDPARRLIVRRQLAFAFPEWTAERVQHTTREVYRNLGITLLETVAFRYMALKHAKAQILLTGADHFANALKLGRGVIVVSAHTGNWELGLHSFSVLLDQPITGVAKPFRFKPLHRWVHSMRTCTGNRILYKKGALAESVKELRQGGVLGLLIDMSRRKDGIEIEFFGHRATATPAAALLAIRCSSPVLPAFCIRTSDGRLHGRIDPPLNIRRTGDLAADLRFNTQLMTNSVEKVVREFPEQWYWRQKRWKDFHPHLYLNK